MSQDTDAKKLMRLTLLTFGCIALAAGALTQCTEQQEKHNAKVAQTLKTIEKENKEKEEREARRRKAEGKMTREDVIKKYGAMSAISARVDKDGYVTNLVNIDTFVGDGAREDRSSPDEGPMAGRNGCGITDTWGPKSQTKRGSVRMSAMGTSTHPRPKPETLNKTTRDYEKPAITETRSRSTSINRRMFDTDGR